MCLTLPLPRASKRLASYWDICSVWETKKLTKPYLFHPRHCPCLAFWDTSVRGFGFSSSTPHIQTQLLTRFKKFIEFSDVEKWHLKRDPEELVLEKVTVFNSPVTLRALAKWPATLNYGLCFSIFNRKLDFLWSGISHTHTYICYTGVHIHTYQIHTHLYTYTYTHAHIYIYTNAYTHAYTHKNTYTNLHTFTLPILMKVLGSSHTWPMTSSVIFLLRLSSWLSNHLQLLSELRGMATWSECSSCLTTELLKSLWFTQAISEANTPRRPGLSVS